MKKYIFFIILIVVAAFTLGLLFPMVKSKILTGKEIVEEITGPDYSKEIRPVLTQFDSIYNNYIQQSEAIGGALVISYKGQIAMIKCFGVKKASENEPVNENTIFRLASVSKTVTGVLAGILASEDSINLDDKVINYIPGLKLNNPESTKNLKVRNLLTHTSGLISHAFDGMVEDQVPLDQIIDRLNEVEIVAPPGQVYGYQNVMFSLIGPVIEKKTNRSFQAVLKNKVFEPFGMKNASVDFESFEKNENKAYPHQKTETGFAMMKLNNRYYSTAAAAGVNASISDMGNFLIAISGKDDHLFSAKAREMVFKPEVETLLKRSYYHNWGSIGTKFYGLGWRIINYKGHTIAHHSGYVSGYQSEIAVCEDEEVGIALLTNSPNSYFSANVPAFLSLFLDYKNKQAPENIAAGENKVVKP